MLQIFHFSLVAHLTDIHVYMYVYFTGLFILSSMAGRTIVNVYKWNGNSDLNVVAEVVAKYGLIHLLLMVCIVCCEYAVSKHFRWPLTCLDLLWMQKYKNNYVCNLLMSKMCTHLASIRSYAPSHSSCCRKPSSCANQTLRAPKPVCPIPTTGSVDVYHMTNCS